MPKRPLFDPIVFEDHRSGDNAGEQQSTAAPVVPAKPTSRRNVKSSAVKTRTNRRTRNYGDASASAMESLSVIRPLPKKASNRRSSQILVKLSDACLNHQERSHNRSKSDGGTSNNDEPLDAAANEADIPSPCRSALSNLSQLIPKLQREIPPPIHRLDESTTNNSNQQSDERDVEEEHAAVLDDVLVLCDFYNSVLTGHYCPHLPRLFHRGERIDSVLDTVHHLMRHLLNPILLDDCGKASSRHVGGHSPQANNDAQETAGFATKSESINRICQTIVGFLSFLVDDCSNCLQYTICLDLISTLEDCSVLLALQNQPAAVHAFPVKLAVFSEISAAVRLSCDSQNMHEYALELHHGDHVYAIQTAVVHILLGVTRQFSNIRHGFPPNVSMDSKLADKGFMDVPSGAVDFAFPPEIVMDAGIIGALITGLRSVLLVDEYAKPSTRPHADSFSAGAMKTLEEMERKSGVIELLMHVFDDWHMLGGFNSIPLPCMVGTITLIAHAVKSYFVDYAMDRPTNVHQSNNHYQWISAYETRLSVALERALFLVFHEYDDGRAQKIQQQILPLLLDCVQGIGVEIRLHQFPLGKSMLRLMFSTMRAIRFMVTTNPNAGMIATNYCMANGAFRHHYSLLLELCDQVATSESIFEIESLSLCTIHILAVMLKTVSPGGESNLALYEKRQILKDNDDATNRGNEYDGMNGVVHGKSSKSALSNQKSSSRASRRLLHLFSTKKQKRVYRRESEFLSQERQSGFTTAVGISEPKKMRREANECFIEFIQSSLYAARNLIDFKMRKENHGLIGNLRQVSSGLSLILSLLRSSKYCPESIIRIGAILCSEIQKSFESIDERMGAADTTMEIEDYIIADVIICCGLSLQFSNITMSDPADESFVAFQRLLESARLFFVNFLASSKFDFQQQPIETFQIHSHGDIEKWLALGPHESKNWSDWCNCESLSTVLSFPLALKGAILMSFLAPTRQKKEASKILQVFEDKIFTSNAPAQRVDSVSSSTNLVSTFLPILPLLLPCEQIDAKTSVCNDEIWTRIQNLMVSAAHSMISETETVLQLFLCAYRGIHMVRQEEYNISLRNPSSVLRFIQIRHRSIRDPPGTVGGCLHGAVVADLYEAILQLPSKFPIHSVGPLTRYLLGNVLTDCLLSHPPLLLMEVPRSLARNTVSWVLSAPFNDKCRQVRSLAFQGVATLITSQECSFVMAIYCSDEYFRFFTSESEKEDERNEESSLRPIAQTAAHGLFREIDGLLKQCGFTDPQLSLTFGDMSNATSFDYNKAESEWLTNQRIALALLAAVRRNIDFDNPIGIAVCEKTLQRLTRAWAAPPVGSSAILSNRSLAFGPLTFCGEGENGVKNLTATKSWAHFSSVLCTDVLLLNTHRLVCDVFSSLVSLIQIVRCTADDSLPGMKALLTSFKILINDLPSVAAQFLIEKDTVCLKLVVGCNCIVTERSKTISSSCSRRGVFVAGSRAGSFLGSSYFCVDDEKLQSQTKDFCLEKMDEILPLLLLHSDPSSLKSLARISGLSLGRIIRSREQTTLKRIVWELGGDDYDFHKTINALKAAALARADAATIASRSRDQQLAAKAAKDWITENFMYLFVNSVQMKWHVRSRQEQIQALRCLTVLFDFLHAEKSSQYFPQVLATLNQAINDGISSDADPNSLLLGLEAVKSLSKFVRLAAKESLETVIDNLTEIVVSLIPTLENPLVGDKRSNRSLLIKSQEEAVSLLQFLAHQDIICRFPKAFSEIPFLPTSEALTKVHESLRTSGIIFDNLCILASPTADSQSGGADQDSVNDSVKVLKNGEKVLALRKRLDVISSLLENENVSVKSVVLNHLTALLRSNRGLFHELVRSEGSASPRAFLTVLVAEGKEHGVITDIVEKLIRRCANESNHKVRIQLATCLGEIGAIAESCLENMILYRSNADVSVTMHRWRLNLPPWQTSAQKYELQIVTKYLVLALRASSTSDEQLKVAFAIQQLLVLLDASSPDTEADSVETTEEKKMNPWLYDQLCKANVYDTVEPFWSSQFNEKQRPEQRCRSRQPPFFPSSVDYFSWISNFCRWMIAESHQCRLSSWKSMFYACRTAVRSFAGLDLSEFLLPLLVADRICNGSEKEFDQIRQEFVMILDFDSLETSPVMSLSERRKAVNAFFCILDTLAYWEERDTEDECRKFRHSKRKSPEKERGRGTGSHWPLEETKTQIRKMRESLPLLLLAKAASGAGMHARALKISELLARSAVVADYFEANDGVKDQEWQGSILHRPLMDAIPVPLMRKALADLDDCETMSSLGQDVSLPSLLLAADSIRAYEAEGNYDGALLRYELALGVKDSQTSSDQAALERGVLGCLLQLGKFESVLSRVESQHLKDSAQTKVYAIEAAWRLGEWDTLSGLIKAPLSGELCGGFDDTFQMSLGRAISSVYHCNYEQAKTDMRTAKESVMGSLSTVARESYAKSYEFLVQLHQIREVEDSFIYFTQDSQSPKLRLEHMAGSVGPQGWFWNGRLHFPTPKAASTIIQTRLAIARLAKDSLYESSLLLQMGRHARKNGLSYAAESFLCSAEATLMGLSCEEGQDIHHLAGLVDEVRNQYAKLKKQSGDNSMALNILNQGATELCFKELMRVEKSASNVNRKLKKIAVAHEAEQIREMFKREPRPSKYSSDSVLAERYARRLLRVTQWTVDSGVQDGAVVERFEVVIKLSAKWEKARFTFARYLNNVISRTLEKELHGESNDNAVRFNALYRDKACQNFILLAMENYTECLFLDSKHLYQALPRLLSLWFDFVSVSEPSEASRAYSKDRIESLGHAQAQARTYMASNLKKIPPAAFYTALPQLISHLFHEDDDTTMVVKKILSRVLYKFPEQSMWHLAWLTGSTAVERVNIGREVFTEAQNVLLKTNNHVMVSLLRESGSLFKYFRDLARLNDKNLGNHTTVKPWRGLVGLESFIPPVQAALSICPFKPRDSGSREYFPRLIPRMRAFSPKVSVMNSKAKPKRLTAFAVPGTWKLANSTKLHSSSLDASDIGEFHFLVKQEAKGDLRKDARVQDLNNVVNRLIDSCVNSVSSLASHSRRLRLRTFAVTCLSEDTGVLEWVPHTDCFRNLITKSYNSQTTPFCRRRRGERLTDFDNSSLRLMYDKSQRLFFKQGNLTEAANEFGELCRDFPPVFSWWFVHSFNIDAHAWYEARLCFTLSAAAWSAVGHMIGLGDRHTENILVETTTGRLLHVDFDCIFDKALNLPRPEIVPFRLTANMIDGFGPTGADGMYKRGMESSFGILRNNKDTLLSVLEPFVKDPVIDWRRHRNQQSSNTSSHKDSFHRAKRSVSVIQERLSGIFISRNPNYRRLKNIIHDYGSHKEDNMAELLPLSVAGQVQKLCLEATKKENLVQLYVGWMPWL